jgi:hypothetical protein
MRSTSDTFAPATSVTGGRRLFKFLDESGFESFSLSGACWDSAGSGIVFLADGAVTESDGFPCGMMESPVVETGFSTDQFVVSWNAITPPGSYLTVYIEARSGGLWSRKFTVAIWTRDNRPVKRMSINGQSDDIARMDTDTLILKSPADAFRVSAKLSSLDGKTYPTVRLLTVHAANRDAARSPLRVRKAVWGKELPLLERSQLTVPDGDRFCSATSTSMVLDYWAHKLNRPELAVSLQTAVDGIYDYEWDGTGNWPFNAAYASEFGGLRAYVTRFSSMAQIEDWIARDVPVIVSTDYNILKHRVNQGRMGHLMVLRGFTADGDCIINDPYTKLDEGESVRRVFKRKDFEPSWLGKDGSLGTVYLVYPDSWDIPRDRYRNW